MKLHYDVDSVYCKKACLKITLVGPHTVMFKGCQHNTISTCMSKCLKTI